LIQPTHKCNDPAFPAHRRQRRSHSSTRYFARRADKALVVCSPPDAACVWPAPEVLPHTTGVRNAPCHRIRTICSSLYRFFFMCFSRSKKPLSPNYGGSKKPGQVTEARIIAGFFVCVSGGVWQQKDGPSLTGRVSSP